MSLLQPFPIFPPSCILHNANDNCTVDPRPSLAQHNLCLKKTKTITLFIQSVYSKGIAHWKRNSNGNSLPDSFLFTPHSGPPRGRVSHGGSFFLWGPISSLFRSASDSKFSSTSSFGSHAQTCSFFSIIFVPLGSLAILPLILSQSRSLLWAASMASIYMSASNACIGPLFLISSLGNANAARPATLSPISPMASLSPCRSLNNFLTASMAMHSLVYCQTRAVDFSCVQVRAGFSLYNPPTYLRTGPAAALYARTISWSDKAYMTCFFWMDCIHSCSSVWSPLNKGNLMPPINLWNPIIISGIPPSS